MAKKQLLPSSSFFDPIVSRVGQQSFKNIHFLLLNDSVGFFGHFTSLQKVAGKLEVQLGKCVPPVFHLIEG